MLLSLCLIGITVLISSIYEKKLLDGRAEKAIYFIPFVNFAAIALMLYIFASNGFTNIFQLFTMLNFVIVFSYASLCSDCKYERNGVMSAIIDLTINLGLCLFASYISAVTVFSVTSVGLAVSLMCLFIFLSYAFAILCMKLLDSIKELYKAIC